MTTITHESAVTIAAAVTAHARANWGRDGWDYIYECWGEADIIGEIHEHNLVAVDVAVLHFGLIAKLHDDVAADIRNA